MENNFTIGLEGMQFYAYHGYYEAERKIGAWYIVDVAIKVQLDDIHDNIEQTINYKKIYAIVEETMQTPVLLIETLAISIKEKLLILGASGISIKIKKCNPPLGGNVSNAFCIIEDA